VQVRHIAGVSTVGRFKSVLLAAGIEVISRCGERRFAFSDGIQLK
jgi:hypothetical protein